MSATKISMASAVAARHGQRPDWRWLFASGALAVVLGVIGLSLTPVLTIVAVLSLGVVLVGASLYQLTKAWKGGERQDRLLRLGYAVAYAFGGSAMIANPPGAATGLTLAIALALGLIGFQRLFGTPLQQGATAARQGRRGNGFVLILAGSLLLVTWPVSSVWAIGSAVAVAMMTGGWRNLVGSWVVRRAQSEAPRTPDADTTLLA